MVLYLRVVGREYDITDPKYPDMKGAVIIKNDVHP